MKKILVAHDGSKISEKALKAAVQTAEKFNASLTVMTVVPELYLTELMESDRQKILSVLTGEAQKMMKKIEARIQGTIKIKTIITQGNPASEIISAADRLRADLIVAGSHGRHGAQKFLLGSVSSKIVDHAHCAVLVVK